MHKIANTIFRGDIISFLANNVKITKKPSKIVRAGEKMYSIFSSATKKIVKISSKRHITIPQKFFKTLGFNDVAECISVIATGN